MCHQLFTCLILHRVLQTQTRCRVGVYTNFVLDISLETGVGTCKIHLRTHPPHLASAAVHSKAEVLLHVLLIHYMSRDM